MPADFDTGYTFETLVKELSLLMGWAEYDAATGKLILPTDAENLRRLQSAVNEGYHRLARSSPHWTYLRHQVEITFYPDGDGPDNIEGDGGRYRLSPWVDGRNKTPWIYTDTSSGYRQIKDRNWMYIRNRFSLSQTSGVPTDAAVVPYEPTDPADRQGWEVIFWPKPGSTYTIEATFRVLVRAMVDLDERHPFGSSHDLTILRCSEEALRRVDEEDTAAWDRSKVEMAQAIAESIAIDRQNRPRSLGQHNDPSIEQDRWNAYRRSRPMTYSGVDLT